MHILDLFHNSINQKKEPNIFCVGFHSWTQYEGGFPLIKNELMDISLLMTAVCGSTLL